MRRRQVKADDAPVIALSPTPPDGLTLRDYFAGQAVLGIAQTASRPRQVAEMAYQIADALLEVRGREEGEG